MTRDRVVLAAVNMPRGHHDLIGPRWPKRGRLAGQALDELYRDRAADALVAAFAEYASPLSDGPLRAEGLRLSRGQANIRSRGQRIGNAVGWLGDAKLRDRARVESLPFIDAPHGRCVLYQPARLFELPHGGSLAVIAAHAPIVKNIAPPAGVRMGREAYAHRVREQLAEDVSAAARSYVAAGHVTAVVGDFNRTDQEYVQRGGLVIADRDVQNVILFGVDDLDVRVAGRGHIASFGQFSDHPGGSPWAELVLPPLGADRPRRLPR
jgi:hypothetical protein